MSELAFYFSNANKLEYDEDVSEDQSSVSKCVQKCPRPVSMYVPSHLDTDLSPPRCHVDKNFGFCVYHNRIVKQNNFRSCQLRDGGSCVSLCTSEHLPPEVEVGNVEYKRKLVNPTPNRFEHLVTQMKWRLNEGGGEAIYRLGVDDDGHVGGLAPGELAGSLDTLERMAKRLNATVHLLQERTVDQGSVPQNAYQPNASVAKEKPQRKALELLVRQSPLTNFGRPNICLAVLGGMDVGKSTLIGVLTDGELDNARGRARLNLFRHLHEVQSGRTSCLSSELLGFDVGGNITNYTRSDGLLSRSSVDELVRNSYQLITLLDSAGHSKYQRTTIAGLARAQPVGALLVVAATAGLTSIGLEHAQLAFSLRLPVAVIISKIDQLAEGVERPNQVLTVCRHVSNKLSQLGSDISQSIDKEETRNVTRSHLLFFPVSAVTGEGIDKLIHFLSGLGRSIRIDTGLGSPSAHSPPTIAGELFNVSESHASLAGAVNPEPVHYDDKDQCFLRDVDQMLLSATAHSRSAFMRFCVREVFTSVAGVPDPVLFGAAQSGRLICGHLAWLGPDQSGEFHLIQIVSLHHNRQPYSVIYAGQTASVAVRFLVNTPLLRNPRRRSTTEQEEVFVMDNDENAPHCADTSFSMPHHQLLPVVLRRGMVLLSNSSWSNANISSLLPFSDPKWFQVPMLVGSISSVGVAWSLEFKLIHRLSIFPGLCASSAVFIPPLPSVNQRVTLYAGCIVQSAVVTSDVSSAQPTSAPLLRVRFTRRPEYMEVGQQLILTWGSCAKAVGSVTALYDFVPSDSAAKTHCCWIDSEAHMKGESLIELSMEQILPQSFTLPDRFQSSHQTHTPPSTSPDFVLSSPNADFQFAGFHAQQSTDACPLLEHSSYETAVDFPATQLSLIDGAHGQTTTAVTQEHMHHQSQALISTSPGTSSGLGTLQMTDPRLSKEPTVPPPLRRPSHRRRRRRKHR